MYVSPWLQARLAPPVWDVAGVLCPPLTVWGECILRTTGNAYLAGRDPDRDAAAEVLVYASHDARQGRRLYYDARYRAKARRRVVRALRRREWLDIHAAVSEYLAESLRTPGHKEVENKPGVRRIAAPLSWVLVEYLSGGDPAKVEAAWDCSFAVAVCLLNAGRDSRGESDSLISEADEERIDRKLAARALARKDGP
jgi:hypothetical protein